jgi:hypothetical protein
MVAITATNSATSSLQATLGRTRLEQARREADQAEARAQELRALADDQDRVAAQALQRVRSLKDVPAVAVPTSGSTAPSPEPSLPGTPKIAVQADATYAETLGAVFQSAKTLTSAHYTFASQKNVVVSSLFQAASHLWSASSASPASSHAIGQYLGQAGGTSNQAAGGVVNAVA